MADDNLKTLVAQGLTAMHAGGEVAKGATQEIQDDATSPELKQALEQGTGTAQQWQQRIERALQEAGGPTGENSNPILEAHYEVSKRIRAAAPDDNSRDLGIVANGQLALHYWIAAFGTLRNYAEKLGMSETAQAMRESLDEAKQADQKHNEIAEALLREPAMA
jgi:ferritin-like metal-binding protein YciE